MLEYLILVLTPFAQGETRVQVRVYDGSVQVTVDSLAYPQENGVIWLEDQTAQRWLKALEGLRISGWRSSYQLEKPVLDALSWSLEYKQAGKRCRHIGGQSAYPPNWLDFLAVMDCIAPILDPGQIDRLSLTVLYPPNAEDEEEACREFLMLDRGRGVIMLGSMRPDGCLSSQSYFAPDDVGMLLERCRALSWESQGDAAYEETGIPAYELEIEFHKNGVWEKKGLFGREDLPAGWRMLMDAVEAFRRSHAQSERMFSRRVYGRSLSGAAYIYCSVAFEDSAHAYFYRTADASIRVGDRVAVPFGPDDRERIGCVTAVERYAEEDVPFPLERTKLIARRDEGAET